MPEIRALQNFIAGEHHSAASGLERDLVNPTTGAVFAASPESGAEDVDAAYDAAGRAFDQWRRSTPKDRQEALLGIADAVASRAAEIVAVECENTGKPLKLTLEEEIPPTVDQLRFFAGAARHLEGKSAGEYLAGHTSWIRREPVGVIGQITPWNYPMMMAVWKFAPAIAAGNTVVVKPSDTTPASTLLLAEIAADFLPHGVFNVVCGGRETGRLVAEHPRVDMVAITGSVGAGMAVAASAAQDLKRVHLELGGNAPVVVFDDADIISAAESIAAAAYFNAGQDCTAATRVLAASDIHDELVAALAEQARSVVSTHDRGIENPDAYLPALNNADQLSRVSGFVERLPDHAALDAGGSRVGTTGFHFAATVVSDLHPADEIVTHEVFGPVITVQRFGDEDEALRLANGSQYGLAASVWTSDFSRAMRWSRDLDFGCVWINAHIPFVSEMPHGGFKHSGYGKDLSAYGFEDYTRIKHVMANVG